MRAREIANWIPVRPISSDLGLICGFLGTHPGRFGAILDLWRARKVANWIPVRIISSDLKRLGALLEPILGALKPSWTP